jgi:alpha-amylase
VLSDDIAFRFSNSSWSEWPLTVDKYSSWLNKIAPKSELINIFLDYETFGEHNKKNTGIFDFLSQLPSSVIKKTPYSFVTPTEAAELLQPVSAISIPSPISWADEERDITAWNGNELQKAALDKLYSLADKVRQCEDYQIKKDWEYLQASDHFYYMATKFFSDGAVHAYFNPYDTPYDAFMNDMNVLSDFEMRLNRFIPDKQQQDEILKLNNLIKEKESIIDLMTTEIEALKKTSQARKTVSKRITPPKSSLTGKLVKGNNSGKMSLAKSKALKKPKSSKPARDQKSKK